MDEDILNDTYLKLTYNYKPDIDFIKQYCYYFNLLKGAYYRDSKVYNYLVIPIEDRDFSDIEYEEQTPIANAVFIEGIKAESKVI